MVERYSLSYRNGAYYLSELLEGGAQLVDAHEYDRLTALIKEMAVALEWVDAEYENQDLNHEDFRVGAKVRANAALQKYKEQQS